MPAEEEFEAIKAMVRRAADQLSDHVDSVVVVVTKHNPDGSSRTKANYSVRGNYYAARDSVREWLVEQDQADRENMKAYLRQQSESSEDGAG